MKWIVVMMLIATIFLLGLSDGSFFDKLPDGYEIECYGASGDRRVFDVMGKTVYVSSFESEEAIARAAVYKGENRPNKKEIAKIFRAAMIMTESGEGYVITYYYTPKLKNKILEGSIFNLVVVETAEKTVVSNGIYPGSF